MDFMTAIKTCMSAKYATFSGRALRSEFWFFTLFVLLASLVANVVDYGILGRSTEDFGPISAIFSLAVLVPSFAAGARRLHDTDRSGWWQLLVLIPIIGVIVLIVFFATKGEDGDNRFGAAPKAAVEG